MTAGTGKRYLIFDPTWEKTPFGQLEHNLQGGFGILLEGANSEAMSLPVLDPTLDTIRRTAKFRLDPDGLLKGEVREQRFGDAAELRRTVYSTGDAKEQLEFLDHTLERDLTDFKASNVKAENVGALKKDFILTYSLDAERYARTMGSLLMVRPRVLGTVAPEIDHRVRLFRSTWVRRFRRWTTTRSSCRRDRRSMNCRTLSSLTWALPLTGVRPM